MCFETYKEKSFPPAPLLIFLTHYTSLCNLYIGTLLFQSSAKRVRTQNTRNAKTGNAFGECMFVLPLSFPCHSHLSSLSLPTLSPHSLTPYSSRCVDPLDGTKEFIKRNDQFTVNIGLCDADGKPIAGVVYCPALTPPVIYKGVMGGGPPIKEECDAVGGAAGYDSFKTIQPKVNKSQSLFNMREFIPFYMHCVQSHRTSPHSSFTFHPSIYIAIYLYIFLFLIFFFFFLICL